MTLIIMTFSITLRKCEADHKGIQSLCQVYVVNADCRSLVYNAECRYTGVEKNITLISEDFEEIKY
jgi:hypothetical protein